MKRPLLFLFLLLSYCESFAQSPCREVVGYYPGWQWYDRNKLVKPSSIDYSKYSILQYAFMNLLADGHLQITDPWGDKNLLLGDINWSVAPAGYDTGYDFGNPAYHLPNSSLSYYAHLHQVKLLMSIGGWTQSVNFAGVASDADKRATFIADCVTICGVYELDGIDIDWEYPSNTSEGNDFLTLLQELRTALDAAEVDLQRELMITAAVGANPSVMANMPWSGLSQVLDIINLMSYDFYGSWDPVLNHNSPLYAPAQGNPEWSCAAAAENLINEYGVAPDKITMGIPFYGRTQLSSSLPVLFGNGNGSVDWLHFSVDEGTPLYYNILLQEDAFEEYWDDQAKVPYKISAENNSFLSYDNAESVAEKAQYIVDHALRGAIIWEITGDYIETSPGSGVIANTPLANAIEAVFCASPSAVKETEMELTVYPVPAENYVVVSGIALSSSDPVILMDMCGHQIEATYQISAQGIRLETTSLKAGYYILNLKGKTCAFLRL